MSFFFIFYGILKENDRQHIKLIFLYSLIMLIPMFLQFYAIPFQLKPSYRVIFMFFPFFILAAAFRIHEFCKKLENYNYSENLNKYFWYILIMGFYFVFNFAFSIFYLNEGILNSLNELLGNLLPI